MTRLIDADALESKYRCVTDCETNETYMACPDYVIDDAPTVDVEPERKRGKWIHRWSGCGSVWLEQRCSECGLTLEEEPIDYNYCPKCGADMRGEE